jgi:hypothetical protein
MSWVIDVAFENLAHRLTRDHLIGPTEPEIDQEMAFRALCREMGLNIDNFPLDKDPIAC